MPELEPGPLGPLVLRYWGKTSADSADAYHPVVFHGLDVAATGLALLEESPLLRRRLASASGLPENRLLPWLSLLLALHDLGKVADSFQSLRPDLMAKLQGRSSSLPYVERHDRLGYRLLGEILVDGLAKSPEGPGADREDLEELAAPWLWAVSGHHGRPPMSAAPLQDLGRLFPPPVRRDAVELLKSLAALLLPSGSPLRADRYPETRRAFVRSSWLVAGWATLADWIGSNAEWFPFYREPLSIEDYWRRIARPRAKHALARSGVGEARAGAVQGLRGLWPELRQPTPLQDLAEKIELAAGPQLFIIEEVTGGGKTEAALVLVQRLMAAGEASGLYFGLPTMATANAMHRRVERIYRRLYRAETRPVLSLAHSRRHLAVPLAAAPKDPPYRSDEPTASLDAAAWLGDSRKKSLLAHVGVGTIDQALVGILPRRHQSLRLWGLAGKVLLADEVHACDGYMQELLCDLLRFQAGFGGSAILLSATLPAGQREKLLAAFAEGAGWPPPEPKASSYPLVTHLSAAHELVERPVAAREAASRRVAVSLLSGEAAVDGLLSDVVATGQCACWVRNTVGDAVDAYQRCRGAFGDRVLLFHSRFTVADRARIEEDVLGRFGPDSGPVERKGWLLIATQVVEQSLDLDFDVMISDLAPIDLLVQRAGRLRRHHRLVDGTRTAGADERGPVVLAVLSPPPDEAPPSAWYGYLFPRAAFVYPDHGRLWLTARWLHEHGGFSMPEDARNLIEWAYGPESGDRIPPDLELATLRAEGKIQADRSLARLNALSLEHGYDPADSPDWPEDIHLPTRLGEPTVTLRLVRSVAGHWEPWHPHLEHPWERSEVQVREWLAAAEDPAVPNEIRQEIRKAMPDEGRYCRLLVLTHQLGGWQGRCLDGSGELIFYEYDGESGLVRFAKEARC